MTDKVIEKQLTKHFEDYYSKTNIFFDFIEKASKGDIFTEYFKIFRANYFYRTFNTIPCISKLVIAAAKARDYETLADVGKNLFEETGEGDEQKVHSYLLEKSHNIHGEKIFNLPHMSLKGSQNSPLILDEAKYLRKIQNNFYESDDYHVVLAISYAQETVATHMLKRILECFFVPFSSSYSFLDFEFITRYFTCHITGLEQRHSEDAKQALFKNCKTSFDWEQSLSCISRFLEAQANLWIGIHNKLLLEKEKKHILLH